jgi:hypothetical protein
VPFGIQDGSKCLVVGYKFFLIFKMNLGNGFAMDDEDFSRKGSSRHDMIPPFNPYSPEDWKFYMKATFSPDEAKILAGNFHVKLVDPLTMTKEEIKKIRKRQKIFVEGQRTIYAKLVNSLFKASLPSRHYLDGVDEHHGKAAWDKLLSVLDNGSEQNKFNSVMKVMSNKKERKESVTQYHQRSSALYSRMMSLQIQLEDIREVSLIHGLDSQFEPIVSSLMLKPHASYDDIVADLTAFETHFLTKRQEDEATALAVANLSKSQSSAAVFSEDQVKAIVRQALAANVPSTKDDHEDMVCFYCKKRGHCKANCKKRKRDRAMASRDEDGDDDRKRRSNRGGGFASLAVVDASEGPRYAKAL